MNQHSEFEKWDQTYRRLRQTEGLPFSDLLKPEEVASALSTLGIEFRERIFEPVVTLWAFLSQVLSADHSCRDAVGRVLAWRLSQGKSPCSSDTTSYCDARKRLPGELVKQLVRGTGRTVEATAEEAWLWKGRHVKSVDGSTVSMPDTPANQAAFPQRNNQRAGVGFPIARILTIFSLSCAMVLDAAIGSMRGKKTGETTLFRTLWDVFQPGDVLLGDRLFASFRDFAACRARGVDVVARQNATRHTDFRRGQLLGTGDHIVVWKRPRFDRNRFTRAEWEALPEQMEVRELRYQITQSGFRTKEITVVTTLLDSVAYPAADISALYRERWQCELDLRSLKTSMQMDRLRCKTPEMVEKEFWTHLLAYNLIRQTIAEAARAHGGLPRQLSFKGAVQMVNAFAAYLTPPCANRSQLWDQLLTAIATHVVGNRPNRIEPRRLKYRPGKYPYLPRPRKEERQRLCA